MSSTLMFEPVIERGKDLGDQLKHILLRKYEMRGIQDLVLSRGDVGYLSGLRDAGIEGAGRLIEAIEKHGKVRLWLEH